MHITSFTFWDIILVDTSRHLSFLYILSFAALFIARFDEDGTLVSRAERWMGVTFTLWIKERQMVQSSGLYIRHDLDIKI